MPALTHAELEASRNLLFYYGKPGGWEPGSFTTHLIRALTAADYLNREKLLSAFPEYRFAVNILTVEGSTKLSEVITEMDTTP